MVGVIESPCVRNCCLNDEDICLGCFRTLAEVLRWSSADQAERAQIVQNAKQRKSSVNTIRSDLVS
jgi:predicted Fe-S protein YdhL (DUF1289 family)